MAHFMLIFWLFAFDAARAARCTDSHHFCDASRFISSISRARTYYFRAMRPRFAHAFKLARPSASRLIDYDKVAMDPAGADLSAAEHLAFFAFTHKFTYSNLFDDGRWIVLRATPTPDANDFSLCRRAAAQVLHLRPLRRFGRTSTLTKSRLICRLFSREVFKTGRFRYAG